MSNLLAEQSSSEELPLRQTLAIVGGKGMEVVVSLCDEAEVGVWPWRVVSTAEAWMIRSQLVLEQAQVMKDRPR